MGDIEGDAYFFVADKQRLSLVLLAEKAMMGFNKEINENELKLSVLSEISNILTGVYLKALFDFCGLRIVHGVPVVTLRMKTAKGQINGLVVSKNHDKNTLILVESEFVISNHHITTWFMLSTFDEHIKTLMDSIKNTGLR